MVGAHRQDIVVAGRSYTVLWTLHLVEVIRLGWAAPGEHQAIRTTMVNLIPQVTHCNLAGSSLTGDSGEMHGLITCPAGL